MNKTKLLVFDNKVPNTENIILTLNKTRVPASRHTKFLGTIIDCKLSWKEHISSICSKISRINGVLNNLKHFLPQSTLLLLYNSLILPHVNYNLLVWGNAKKDYLQSIYLLQKRAVRKICNVSFTHHTGSTFIIISLVFSA
ncbi:RNA-directed DNA polymerase from mobile element jockey [Holothuria leucospilota]|uniref:RNA-directed DNA polymerase from mobile element jockey n=1 Tax=Holothuria leucospilota TaxID=206669 RepID=A0A9Q1BFD7_HOLLE|nr:RNA-directed DNA polymerase from mobile element jockey [Holothuria leucospilota]